MSKIVNMHRNGKGVWEECGATKRACRYKASCAPFTVHVNGEIVPVATPEQVFEQVEKKAKPIVEVEQENEVFLHKNSYRIPSQKLETAIEKIDKANKKLVKHGLTSGQYEYEYEMVQEQAINGMVYEIAKLTVTKPQITSNGWTFVARIDEIELDDGKAGFITKNVTAEDLTNSYEIKGSFCDHCGKNRKRHKTYVLKDENGQYRQVGSACLEGFLGVKPRGLWSLEEDLEVGDEKDPTPLHSFQNALIPTKEIIAMGLTKTSGGRVYVSVQSEGESTRNQVLNAFFNDEDDTPYMHNLEQAETIIKESHFQETTDYGRNMNLLLSQEYTSPKHIGYVVSAIPAYFKAQKKKEKEASKPKKAKGYIGKEGDKLFNITAKVERISEYESNYGYGGKINRMIIMRTADNKLIKWNSSSTSEEVVNLEKGATVNIERCIVKGFNEYDGEDQTEIKNGKISV